MSLSRKRWSLAALVALHLVLLGTAVGVRPIDGDEGYYGLAARLVAAGAAPYADFFYPQAPVLPYVYAPVAALVPDSLTALRWFSVAASTLMVVLWAVWLDRRRDLTPTAAALALATVAVSPHLVIWNVTVKTYALASLLVTAGLVAAAAGLRAPRPRPWLLAAGVALGLAAGVRLLYAPVALACAAGLVRWPAIAPRAERLRAAAALAAGLAVGALPLLTAWLAGPDRFVFDNLGYHLLRFSPLEDAGFAPRAGAALATAGRAIGGNPFLLLTVLLAAWGAASWRRPAAAATAAPDLAVEKLALLAAATYTATCLLPDPTYAQYFTGGLAPLLLPAAAGGLARLPSPRPWPHLAVAGLLAAAAVVALAVQRPGVPTAPEWRLGHYRRVVAGIRELTAPDAVVLAFWPGYVLGSGRTPYPGTENHFAVGVSELLSVAERTRYHVPGKEELTQAFRREIPDLVVVGTWMHDIDQALDDREMQRLLADFTAHYAVADTVGRVKLCRPQRRLP